jgi:predicted metalloendopeptidase
MSEDSGILISELDSSVRPQDDLFRHVNGKWIARTEIPSDKARYGSFSRDRGTQVRRRLRELHG